jgi:hypothetical protein
MVKKVAHLRKKGKTLAAARLCPASRGPRLLCLPLWRLEGVGTLACAWSCSWIAEVRVWSTSNEVMVAIAALCGSSSPTSSGVILQVALRRAVNCLVCAPPWSGGPCILYLCCRFVARIFGFKVSMATTSALGRWSLGARARSFPSCHQQRQTGSGKEAAHR